MQRNDIPPPLNEFNRLIMAFISDQLKQNGKFQGGDHHNMKPTFNDMLNIISLSEGGIVI